MGRLRLAVLLAVVAAALGGAVPAVAAVPAACTAVTGKVDVFKNVGAPGAFWLENVGFDGHGGMWISQLMQNKLVRFDAQGNAGIALDVPQPGASLIGPDGLMYALYGVTPLGAVPGTAMAGVMRFDPRSPAPRLERFTDGLQMANGAAFDAAGALYVADTTNPGIIRIRRDGTVDPTFAEATPVSGADGLAVVGGTLLATLFTDTASSIIRVPLGAPATYSTLAQLSPAPGDAPKMLDDAAIGPDGALYVAAGSSELFRVDPMTGAACVVATTPTGIDSVRFAVGFPPFDPVRDVFMTTQAGDILHAKLTYATPPAAPSTGSAPATARPQIRLKVTPRRVRRGRTVTLRATVSSVAFACRGDVRVSVGGLTSVTDTRGRARVRLRFRSRGLRTVVARKPGCRSARVRIRVRSAAR